MTWRHDLNSAVCRLRIKKTCLTKHEKLFRHFLNDYFLTHPLCLGDSIKKRFTIYILKCCAICCQCIELNCNFIAFREIRIYALKYSFVYFFCGNWNCSRVQSLTFHTKIIMSIAITEVMCASAKVRIKILLNNEGRRGFTIQYQITLSKGVPFNLNFELHTVDL